MEQAYIPLFSALAGAFIGAAASVLTILIQSVFQERRDRLRIIADLAMKDHGATVELAKNHDAGAVIPPLAAYVAYHRAVLDIVTRRGLTPEDVVSLAKEQRELMVAMEEVQRRRR